MHASHIKKLQPKFQSILLNFKICNFVIKKTFSKKKMYLMKIQKSLCVKKKLDLYLMEIKINFCVKKIISEKYRLDFELKKIRFEKYRLVLS